MLLVYRQYTFGFFTNLPLGIDGLEPCKSKNNLTMYSSLSLCAYSLFFLLFTVAQNLCKMLYCKYCSIH